MFRKSKKEEIDPKKVELLKEGKELGLNLDKKMSIYEIEHRIAQERAKNKPAPTHQPSSKRGEY